MSEEWAQAEWLIPDLGAAHAFRPDKGSAWRSAACGAGYRADALQPVPEGHRRCERCLLSLSVFQNPETAHLKVFHVDTAADAFDLIKKL